MANDCYAVETVVHKIQKEDAFFEENMIVLLESVTCAFIDRSSMAIC